MVEYFLGPPVWQSCKKRDALHLTPPHNPAAASSDVIEERAMNKMKKMMITNDDNWRLCKTILFCANHASWSMQWQFSNILTFRSCLTCCNGNVTVASIFRCADEIAPIIMPTPTNLELATLLAILKTVMNPNYFMVSQPLVTLTVLKTGQLLKPITYCRRNHPPPLPYPDRSNPCLSTTVCNMGAYAYYHPALLLSNCHRVTRSLPTTAIISVSTI